tara:strand:+ start:4111 stop:5007 length:897 start_codon:yes stop_codon:yes gene_type:complete
LNKKKITVLLPTFNDKNIENCLESLDNQTFKNFSIFLINDGGNDISNILKKFTNLDIKYFNSKINNGLTKSLNFGIKNIDSEYLARMDSDDYSMPERLELQLKYLEKGKNDLIGCSVIKVIPNKNFSIKISHSFNQENIINEITKNYCPLAHSTFFGKTSLFKKVMYNENLKFSQDYDFLARAICMGYKLGNLEIPLLIYNSPISRNEKIFYQMHVSNLISKEFCKSFKNKSNYTYKDIKKIKIKTNKLDNILLNLRKISLNRKNILLRRFLFLFYLISSLLSKTQFNFNFRNLNIFA